MEAPCDRACHGGHCRLRHFCGGGCRRHGFAVWRFLASVLIGVIQTFAIAFDYSFVSVAKDLGFQLSDALANNSVLKLTVSQVAPILPYLFLVLILIFRPKGLLGTREG